MVAEVPSLASVRALLPGTLTILVVYAGVSDAAIEGRDVQGSFAPVSTAGPGDRVICIWQNRRYTIYTHVDVPDRAP
jgi:hypothetical protein